MDNLELSLFCLLWVPWQSSWRFLGNPIIPKIESETIDWERLSFSWHKRRCLFYLLESDTETNPPHIQVLWWLIECWGVGATQILFTEPQQQGPEKDSWCYVQAWVCQLVLLFFFWQYNWSSSCLIAIARRGEEAIRALWIYIFICLSTSWF